MAELEKQAQVTVRFPLVPAGGSNKDGVPGIIVCSIPGLAIEQVKDLLQPSKWPELSDFWKSPMLTADGREDVLLVNGQEERFHEHFAVAGLHLDPVLRFRRLDSENPPACSLEYRLAEPPGDGDLVLIDEGSIFLRELRDGLHITTTKRVRFAPPFDGQGLGLLASGLGYLDAFEEMVSRAVAKAHGKRADQMA